MHLKTVCMKGFKSFPDRVRLDFGPGVSVVVGPNGSGKSNVTDAVLWAMGEQSPLAVRGQSMQDVIFGGGRGVKARSAAEVEIVLDNSDATIDLPFGEISILRRLDRSGEGEYRLNGARCRLIDLIEVLSDTGLGKEAHSVISQGKIEAIVTSKPRDRRLLIEEAAGLGKHRRRRRRAQIKLEHTQDNLDRALEIEREARTRLRPLKRQAEAAELHERLQRQTVEIAHRLAQDSMRASSQALSLAESEVLEVRAERDAVEDRLADVVKRRDDAEAALAARVGERDELSRRASRARSSGERLKLRREQAEMTAELLSQRIDRVQRELAAHEQLIDRASTDDRDDAVRAGRIGALERELAVLDRAREAEIDRELQSLADERDRAREIMVEMEGAVKAAERLTTETAQRALKARERLREAERAVEAARRDAASVGAELAAVNQFLRSHGRASTSGHTPDSGDGTTRPLGAVLKVRPGYELALAAALGGRLDASLAPDIAGAASILDGAGPDGGTILLYGFADDDAAKRRPTSPPTADALPLIDLVQASEPVMGVAGRLLHDAWVVESLTGVSHDFTGIATTRGGRVWLGAFKEVRQLPAGGSERVLARRNERETLTAATAVAAQNELEATTAVERERERLTVADAALEAAEQDARDSRRRYEEAGEHHRRSAWLIDQRRIAPDQGPLAVRRAQLEGELAAERRQADRLAGEIAERLAHGRRLSAQRAADKELAPRAIRLARAVAVAEKACGEQAAGLEQELTRDRERDLQLSVQLRRCAGEEAEIQGVLRAQGERVTTAEVAAQRLRDRTAEAAIELDGLREQLGSAAGSDPESLPEPLSVQEREALSVALGRLQHRREQVGPVNPLAKEEYAEALAHVQELESRRCDLEQALRELRTVIRETDTQIHEIFQATFTTAATNFQDLVKDVFPGGHGCLRLVAEESASPHVGDDSGESGREGESHEEGEGETLEGVEIEIAPAGKSSKRLSLLSGGEKSMTALAFLFAVFLARPCPFYILDEVEAALDDLNLDRFLTLLRRYSGRAQFIVITHQKHTMDAADSLYGISMGDDGVSKVLSRRLPRQNAHHTEGAVDIDTPEGAVDTGSPSLTPPSPQAVVAVRRRISDGVVSPQPGIGGDLELDGSDVDSVAIP